MYYVRKMAKPPNLKIVRSVPEIRLMSSDFLGQELRTKENSLSVWRSETLESDDVQNAIYAALFSSSDIEATQFIILDSEALELAGIHTDDSQPGKTGYKGYEKLHTNLCDLNYEKIGLLLDIYCSASKDDKRIPKIEKDQFRIIVKKVHDLNVLDVTMLDEHLQKAVQKVLA